MKVFFFISKLFQTALRYFFTNLDMIECVIKTFPFPMKSEWGRKENDYVVFKP